MASILLEARPYRPFKSCEEYLEAMKEDLAEWLNMMYPDLEITAENFMERLDTGVALCKHANYVRQAAEDYVAKRQARNKSMTRSMTSGLAGPILTSGNVHYLPAAKSGTFFSRDNVSNFIAWCRKSLKIFECLLFETDDLIMRKNEKHVILCLLEVARRGAKFGMLAPMLVQMERQIDREIAADNRANGIGCGTQTEQVSASTETEMFDTDTEDEDDNGVPLMYGPQPQIITNDLKSLDEMVRDLVEKCTCPSQFPMVRVSEGKYRIGDTKVLIFVRILRSHVMVRVGGGWDTLSNYLNKHDPCRCKNQHKSSVGARLNLRASSQTNGMDLHKAQVIYERSPPSARRTVGSMNSSPTNQTSLSPPNGTKTRSRSPTPQRKFLNQLNNSSETSNNVDKLHTISSPNMVRRSISPSPRRLGDIRKKQTSLDSGPSSVQTTIPEMSANRVQFDNLSVMSNSGEGKDKLDILSPPLNEGGKFENISDNGSEISDEGYRSLGIVQSNAQKRESLHSQTSVDDAESNVRLDQTSSDSQLTLSEEKATADQMDSLTCDEANKFEQNGVFITDDEITVDVAAIPAKKPVAAAAPAKESKIPRSPVPVRRRSVDGSSCSLSDLPAFNRKKLEYRSVRTPSVATPKKTVVRDVTNTWSGRVPATGKQRPAIERNTFDRNSKARSSAVMYDSNGRRIKGATASLTTSPVKSAAHQSSPLAQQILEAANNAKNDAQMLERMKALLSKYSVKPGAKATKKPVYEDFTTAWVHSNGNLERSSSCSPPTKGPSKRSSAASSTESTHSRDLAAAITSPRRDRGLSKIPAPIRHNTELY